MTARGVVKHLPIKYSDRGFVLNGASLSATSSLDHLIQRLHDRHFVASIPAQYRPPGPLKQGVPRGAGDGHDSGPDADYVNDHDYVNAAAQSGIPGQDGYHSVLTRNKQRQPQQMPGVSTLRAAPQQMPGGVATLRAAPQQRPGGVATLRAAPRAQAESSSDDDYENVDDDPAAFRKPASRPGAGSAATLSRQAKMATLNRPPPMPVSDDDDCKDYENTSGAVHDYQNIAAVAVTAQFELLDINRDGAVARLNKCAALVCKSMQIPLTNTSHPALNGIFLLRRKPDMTNVISVLFQGKAYHFRIVGVPSGGVRIAEGLKGPGQTFPNLPQLIDAYRVAHPDMLCPLTKLA